MILFATIPSLVSFYLLVLSITPHFLILFVANRASLDESCFKEDAVAFRIHLAKEI